MELWLLIILTACITILLNAFFSFTSKNHSNLPPCPRPVPLLDTILWFRKSSLEKEQLLKQMGSKFGPMTTFYSGSVPQIFISDRNLAHQALIQLGAIFADRPSAPPIGPLLRSNVHPEINSSSYGPIWRLLRRNLTSKIFHPSKSNDFTSARKWVLDILVSHMKQGNIKVIDHFRFAMFSLLVFMCFGDKLDESRIREIEEVVHQPLESFNRFQVLNSRPWLTRVFLRNRWNELFYWRKKQDQVIIPYIRAKKELHEMENVTTCYVDTLLELEIEEGDKKRKLSEEEIVTACTEFLGAGYDTTSTALQWIMANLVNDPEIQAKLVEEIKEVVGEKAEDIREVELSKMSYLKAVVLEGLRRHPPFHFVLPHAVTQDVHLSGYMIPKDATINFTVAEMGWDPEIWGNPMEFRPGRFMSGKESDIGDGFDITGSRKIKMMPFGVGRRICPGLGFALHHLEYFVANLVWRFEWGVVEGKEVDFCEKQEFTIVMKNPLHAHISPRILK